MAIVTFPPSARIASISWTLDRPAQVNRSRWTGQDQVAADPWHGRWSAQLELAPIVGEGRVLEWRAFIASLRGRVNSFRLPATEGGQAGGGFAPFVFGDGQPASRTALQTAGWPTWNGTFPKPGQMMTVRDQLVVMTAVEGGNDIRLISFEAQLRQHAVHLMPVEFARPTALVALTGSTAGWSVGRGTLYGVSLTVEERF